MPITAIAGPGANNVTVRGVSFTTDIDICIAPGGDNWVVDDVDANGTETFIASTAGHDYLRVTNSRTAGQISTNGTSHIVMEGNIYRSLFDFGTDAADVHVSGILDSPGGSISAILKAVNLKGFVIDLEAYECSGYDMVDFTGCEEGIIDGIFGDLTGGAAFTGCVDVDVRATIGANGYLGGHGVVFDDCTRCYAYGKIIEPGQDTADTYDGVHVSGDSVDCGIKGARIIPGSANATRSAVNIADGTVTGTRIVANDFGDTSLYGTSDIINNGASTHIGPNDHEWDLGLPGDRVDGEAITWDAVNEQWVLGDAGGSGAASGAGVGTDSSPSYATFYQSGTLTTGTGTFKLPFTRDAVIGTVKLAVGTAPTGAAIIVDVNKNGTSIYPTSSKPQIAAGSTVGANADPDTTSISAGDYLTVDIDQIGSSVAGADLTVVVEWSPA